MTIRVRKSKKGTRYEPLVSVPWDRFVCECGWKAWASGRAVVDCPECGGALRRTTARKQISGGTYGDRRAARRREIELLHEHGQGTAVVPSDMKLGQLVDDSLAVSAASSAHSTPKLYRRLLDSYCSDLYGARVQSLSAADITRHQMRLLETVGPGTVSMVRTALYGCFRNAVRWGVVTKNIIEDVPRPKVSRRAKEHHTVEEVAKIVEASKDDELYPLVVVLAVTGMRRGELLALRRSDVDLDTATVRIERSINEHGVIGPPKTESGRRTIRIDDATVAVLRRHLAAQAKERLRLGEVYDDHGLLFARADGTPIPPPSFTHRFRGLCIKAGVRPFGPHSFRHAFATAAITSNLPGRLIAARLGHSSPVITETMYGAASSEMDLEVAQVMGKRILGG